MRRRRSKAPSNATGASIRTQRRARKVTQLALAEALGITFDQLQKRTLTRSGLSPRRLRDIASILGVSAPPGSDPAASPPRTTSLSLIDMAGAMRLMRAYAALPTPRMKRALVTLAEQMAGMTLQSWISRDS